VKAKSPAEVARDNVIHGQEVGKIIGCGVSSTMATQVQLTRDAAVQMGRFIAENQADAIITWDSFNVPIHSETSKIIMDAVRCTSAACSNYTPAWISDLSILWTGP
jgi:hypothetical protein